MPKPDERDFTAAALSVFCLVCSPLLSISSRHPSLMLVLRSWILSAVYADIGVKGVCESLFPSLPDVHFPCTQCRWLLWPVCDLSAFTYWWLVSSVSPKQCWFLNIRIGSISFSFIISLTLLMTLSLCVLFWPLSCLQEQPGFQLVMPLSVSRSSNPQLYSSLLLHRLINTGPLNASNICDTCGPVTQLLGPLGSCGIDDNICMALRKEPCTVRQGSIVCVIPFVRSCRTHSHSSVLF